MRNKLIKTTVLSLIATTAIYAGGYKIPETSLNGIALSAANVAHGHGADTAYYNPANMAFMKDENRLEADLIYIGLDPVKYKGTVGSDPTVYDIDAKSESFLIPSLNYVSPKLGNARVGLSIVVPGGLSKRWDNSPAKDVAQEFTLEVVEINPSVAIPVNDKLAIAFGFRILYSNGIVKSTSPATASRDMTGDSIDFGYNVALAYKPTKQLEFGLTYRSKVNLSEEGNAKLYVGGAGVYDGGSSVSVPLPALFNAAVAYTFESKTTVEFVYERNFWSSYNQLDFNYVSSIPTILTPMDAPIAKNWKDTSAYRLGITQELGKMSLMAGVVYDNSPVPDSSLSFELPDSDSLSVSLGGRYKINDKLDVGLSALYSMRDSRTISAANNNNKLNGEFSNADVLIISAGLGYKF
jgi:long-chain fatty acid transport protein